GDRARGARGHPALARRRVPRAHRGGHGTAGGGIARPRPPPEEADVSDVVLTLRQLTYTNRAFWRNPASAFFTFAFPLMFLVIFTSLLGNGTVRLGGIEVNQATYYVAGMAAFSVISACYTNIAISVSFNRDAGILKRVRGTPLPG